MYAIPTIQIWDDDGMHIEVTAPDWREVADAIAAAETEGEGE